MQPHIQFYTKEIGARIAKHEAAEKQNPAKLKALRAERRQLAIELSGVKETEISALVMNERSYSRAVEIKLRSSAHIDRHVTISDEHPRLAKNTAAIAALVESQKTGCVECDQLRALIDTKGINSFTAFLRARCGKSFTVSDAKEALPEWIRLRAPAACPVLL